MTISELWDNIIDYDIATENELQLITTIMGYNEDVLNSVIYTRTGYHNWEQFATSEIN